MPRFQIDKNDQGEPLIHIPKQIWEDIVDQAKLAKENNLFKAFFLYSPSKQPLNIVDYKEVPTHLIKEDPKSGAIFRWKIPKNQFKEYYPQKTSNRYFGTIIIQKNLDLTFHYAYWMGADFKHFCGFNINLWIGDDDKEIHQAYFVSNSQWEKDDGQTHGEFLCAKICVD